MSSGKGKKLQLLRSITKSDAVISTEHYVYISLVNAPFN